MKIFVLLVLILAAIAGCARLPTTAEMRRDVRELYIEKYKQVEDSRIKRWEKLFPPEKREDENIKPLFQRLDLSSYIEQMDTLEIVDVLVTRDMLYGLAEYANNYGSKFQVKFSYARTSKGWELSNKVEEQTLSLSNEDKRRYLRTNISRAIIKFANDHGRYPRALVELAPRYIKEIPDLAWIYFPDTGELK
jgi:hypothetical protein